MDQPVIDTLTLALDSGAVRVPADRDILFLNAQECTLFRELPENRVICDQSFKPWVDELEVCSRRVLKQEPEQEDTDRDAYFDLAIYLPSRQKVAMKIDFVRALNRLNTGGVVLCALPNSAGAKSAQKLLEELCGNIDSLAKNKCRAFWAEKTNDFNIEMADDWKSAGKTFEIPGTGVFSQPGLFSWDRIDPGSQLLAEHLPDDLQGRVADVGAGQGYLSLTALKKFDKIEMIDLFEAEYRAVQCSKKTLKRYADKAKFHWQDATKGLPASRYDFVVMNPPFHTSRADDASLGQAFIRSAARALKPRGRLYMVANRHLPYEAALSANFTSTERLADIGGYKVICAAGPKKQRR